MMTRYTRTVAFLALGILAVSLSACKKEPVATESPSGRTVGAPGAPTSESGIENTSTGTRVTHRRAGPVGAPPRPGMAPPGPLGAAPR